MFNLVQRAYRKFIYSPQSGLMIEQEDLYSFVKQLIPYEVDLFRVGSAQDGGYLLPTVAIKNIKKVFSPGVGTSSDFEFYFAEQGIPCFLADASVPGPILPNENFHFSKQFVGSYQAGKEYISFNQWVTSHCEQDEGNFLLQMDIEGWEYNNLLYVEDAVLSKFDVLVIEFHRFNDVCFKSSFPFFQLLFQRLLENYIPVHLHPNNQAGYIKCHDLPVPELLEITFLRKGIIKETLRRRTTVNHNLDTPNVKGDFQISLESWCKA